MALPAPPVKGLLVPAERPAPSADLVVVRQPLQRGLPDTVQLDAEVSVALLVPNGMVKRWSDADPEDLVSEARPQRMPFDPAAPGPVGAMRAAPVRLAVERAGELLGIVPLTAGLHRTLPADGAGLGVELEVLDWEIRAGSMKGAGDFGSFIVLAWRRADQAVDTFRPPPVHRRVAERLGPGHRVESLL